MQAADIKTKAIVVRAVPYKESDMLVTLVGVDMGKLTATARGCLKRGAKLRYAAEPFNFGDYVLSGRNGRYVITECSQIESFHAITDDLDSYYAGCMVLDALGKLSDEPQPQLMLSALRTLGALESGQEDADRIVTKFLLELLSLNGNQLDFAHCNVCKCNIDGDAFFRDADGIVCEHCKGLNFIRIDAISRAYLAGGEQPDRRLRGEANAILAQLIYEMLGVRISTRYFTEQI